MSNKRLIDGYHRYTLLSGDPITIEVDISFHIEVEN